MSALPPPVRRPAMRPQPAQQTWLSQRVVWDGSVTEIVIFVTRVCRPRGYRLLDAL